MNKFVATLLLAVFALAGYAQNMVKGKVVDAETGESLIGASVVVKGTDQGTVTDLDGMFELRLDNGAYTLVISYTGYETTEVPLNVKGDTDLGTIEVGFGAVGLSEVEVIASVAIDRRTPVAVTSLKGDYIAEVVGNQEFPEVLRKSPSVYVTKQGGGFGDSRINVRGFDQRNTAVMINGVPVNDMENGWVYWSNWAGLADVTSRIDYQRGLGASKLVVPSVGGSINIVTNAASMKKGGSVAVNIGNDGYQKYALVYNTGLSDKGFAFTGQLTHTRGDGYVEGTMFRAYSYFLSLTKQFNDKHTLAITALGAPQWHHQRFIPGRFDGVTLRTFVDPDNTGEPGTNRGIKYNWLWGTLNGEEFNWRRNFYNKPIAFVNHYWTISPKTDVKTSLYASWGIGGGTGPRGRINSPNGRIYDSDSRLRDENGHVLFDDIVAWNQGQAVNTDVWGQKAPEADGPFAGKYITTRSGEGFIRRASMNYHRWYGIYSTLTHKFNSNLNLIAGIDGRWYKGEHFRRVENLLGNDAYLSTADVNAPGGRYITIEAPAKFGSFYNTDYRDRTNVINYYNDGLVTWMGLFTQLEYTTDQFSAFIALTGSNQGFKRIDYFNYADNDPNQATDWQNFLGGTVKAGANYNINEHHNVFVNGGYFSRQPIFDNVFINYRNDINEDVKNQTVSAFEIGYGYRSAAIDVDLNYYYTVWGNRQFDITVDNDLGEEVFYNFENVSQTHSGIELEFTAKPSSMIEINGMLSVGNWVYSSNFEAQGYNLDQNKPEGTLTIYADGLKVGDAAQTTASLGFVLKPVKGLRFWADYYIADNLYARYDVTDSQFLQPGGQIVQLPAYSLVDAGISYRFKMGELPVRVKFNMYNVLDEQYVSELVTNIQDDPNTPDRNEFYDNRGVFGFGRTWSAGIKVNF